MSINPANKLINESSPYLLQHSTNPVDWYPWSDEAFNLAVQSDKPIFLSIGYSTCHWCHVMEKESFEDFEVAEAMNNTFVCIKVDREERPDIDQVYMTVCQMLTGGGGWPLTIIMTPDKKPFFAGTYFPKESQHGRIGMLDLVEKVNDVWNNNRDEVYQSAEKITFHLLSLKETLPGESFTDEIVENAVSSLKRLFDTQNGGFGTAPKFPSPHNLLFLLDYFYKTKDSDSLKIIETTFQSMYKGGIFDHVGYGFHRYSTDRKWLLPHFEKMLYDQATISFALIKTYSITKNELYKNITEKIFTYVERDLLSPEGFFYSAEDADSEGIEGKFYTWTKKELSENLTQEELNYFCDKYNIEEYGNYEHESSRVKDGSNIPFLSDSSSDETNDLILNKLFTFREKRVRPLRDEKMLTDWNSLMIASLAYAARVFNNQKYLSLAERAAEFILKNMLSDNYSLKHVFNKTAKDINGKLDDYSFFVFALLELYNSTFNHRYLFTANKVTEFMIDNFSDEKGGFFFTSKNDETLITRPKDIYDSAIPSGNSVAVLNLIRLSRITGDDKYIRMAEKYLNSLTSSIDQNSMSFSFLLSAYLMLISPSKELIITDGKMHDYFELAVKFENKYSPSFTKIILNESNYASMINLAPYLNNYLVQKDKTLYYLCENYTCNLPEDNLERILNGL